MMKKLIRLLKEPNLAAKYILNKISLLIKNDEFYLKLKFKVNMGYWPNLNNPKTFNEKLQWLKLHDRKVEYTTLVDKYAVKQYVTQLIGKEYVIPTLGVWDSPDDIDFNSLPNQFVLKCTHDSGGLCICKDKSKLNIAQVKERLHVALKHDYYYLNREWPYTHVQRKIIAEKLLETENVDIFVKQPDYKFYCFNGEPKYCQVVHDCNTKEIYDMNWGRHEFVGFDSSIISIARPKHLDEMADICCHVAKNIPFARVDLYKIKDDNKYLGEIFSYSIEEKREVQSDTWNKLLGDMINLEGVSVGHFIAHENGDVFPLTDEIKDYKFFCFKGKVHCFKVDFNRFTKHQANYYTPDGTLLKFGEIVCPPDYEHIEIMPSNLNKMIILAEKLSEGKVFMRVDFYNVNGRIYFGELTFFPAGGIGAFTNNEADEYLGSLMDIKN